MPYPLGRVVHHDPRSRQYAFKAARGTVLQTVKHYSNVGILNQGDLGSCTGHATVAALGCEPFWGTFNDTDLNHDDAVAIYSLATILDEFGGSYPPVDTGSSGLAAAKAAQQKGYISGYQHAFNVADALAALQKAPLIAGISWYSSFDEPDQYGQVRIADKAYVRGGHEVCLDAYDAANGLVWFRNSWGSEWALEGRAALSVADYTQLMNEDGDTTIFVPNTEKPPVPEPPATSDRVLDEALVKFMDPWSKSIISRITKAGKASAAYRIWKISKGL